MVVWIHLMVHSTQPLQCIHVMKTMSLKVTRRLPVKKMEHGVMEHQTVQVSCSLKSDLNRFFSYEHQECNISSPSY